MINDFNPKGYPYHGWLVDVLNKRDGFRFECYDPDLLGSWGDWKVYPNYDVALIAGKQFVDRFIATLALLKVLDDWVKKRKISPDEYESAIRFDAARKE